MCLQCNHVISERHKGAGKGAGVKCRQECRAVNEHYGTHGDTYVCTPVCVRCKDVPVNLCPHA